MSDLLGMKSRLSAAALKSPKIMPETGKLGLEIVCQKISCQGLNFA